MLLQYLVKIKIQVSADIQPIWNKMQAGCILIASNFVICQQILIFSVPILIADKIFHVTVLLVIYFCDHCSVCQQSTWYSARRTRF